MCGIFGVLSPQPLEERVLRSVTDELFRLSESRGKEASGLTLLASPEAEELFVLKSPAAAADLIRNKDYRSTIHDAMSHKPGNTGAMAAFGHTRLVTNGSQVDGQNNQPVLHDGGVIVHNGIIVNVDELWRAHGDLSRQSDVDSEIIVALARKYYRENGSPIGAIRKVFEEIKGTASVAMTFSDLNIVVLATNNGSLYLAKPVQTGALYFASERFILEQFLKRSDLASYTIGQIRSNEGLLVRLDDWMEYPFRFSRPEPEPTLAPLLRPRRVVTKDVCDDSRWDSLPQPTKKPIPRSIETAFQKCDDVNQSLRRCKKCILPDTVPFIEFDSSGICNFCNFYKPIQLEGRERLEKLLEPHRNPGRDHDCVMALSGGRDSCYGLQYVVRELGMRPLTYTYDWGMVTDLARRNVSRVCSRLGVENIILSADIRKKRENIRKNVLAWLKKPHLGMVPLFMAGDKQFVWYSTKIKRQNHLVLDIFSFNLMEKTQFKEEYSGAQMWKPGADADKLGEKLEFLSRFKLGWFYAHQFLTNPAYLNRSIPDTFWGYVAYYFLPQTFISLFNFIPWEEETISKKLITDFEWELSPDCQSTWRIGDGTTPFYNYIYYVLGGFTENDTLRSNQIREGHLTRQKALELARRDNQPRWESLGWYTDTIGIDLIDALKTIHEAALPLTRTK